MPDYLDADLRPRVRSAGRRAVIGWLIELARPFHRLLAVNILVATVDRLAGLGLLGGFVVATMRLAQGQDIRTMGDLGGLLAALVVVKAVCLLLGRFLRHLVAFRVRGRLRQVRATSTLDPLEVFIAEGLAPAATSVVGPALVVVGISVFVSLPVAAVLAAGLGVTPKLVDNPFPLLREGVTLITVTGMALIGALTGVDIVMLAMAMAIGIGAFALTGAIERFLIGLDAFTA